MGVFEYVFEIGATSKGPFVTLNALVDTGSSYSWVPGSILRKLGLKSLEKAEFETADGRLIVRAVRYQAQWYTAMRTIHHCSAP